MKETLRKKVHSVYHFYNVLEQGKLISINRNLIDSCLRWGQVRRYYCIGAHENFLG